MKVIKFRSPEIAEKIHAHLYGATIDGDKLFFTKFDQMAFNLAINLEDLSRADYAVFGTEGDRNGPWISRPSHISSHQTDSPWLHGQDHRLHRQDHPQSQTTLEVALTVGIPNENDGMGVIGVHRYGLLVDPTFLIVDGFNEIPLIVNRELVRFADIVQRAHVENTTDIVSVIAVAYCQVDDFRNPSQYHLLVAGDGRSQTIRFYPSSVLLNHS
jgi:hypothetical protein